MINQDLDVLGECEQTPVFSPKSKSRALHTRVLNSSKLNSLQTSHKELESPLKPKMKVNFVMQPRLAETTNSVHIQDEVKARIAQNAYQLPP